MKLSSSCLFLISGIASARSSSPDAAPPSNNDECGVYLAPSTIPGAGLGMYAGKSYGKGEHVTYGDVIFPIIELNWHNGHENFFWLWDEYTWSFSVEEHMEFETESASDLSAASPGIGAALNCMLSLVNLEDTFSQCDNAGLHRSKDPGAGAITPYHGRGSKAAQPIHMGDELFIDYGENYFESRGKTYGQIPMKDNFNEADVLLYNFHHLQSEVLKYYPDSLQQDLWKLITDLNTRTTNALPSSLENATAEVLRKGGTGRMYEDRSRHSLEWLQEHGQCMDNIRNGMSEIPQAGRGAFATRFLPAGSLVAPAPLIHIPNRTQLVMYETMPPDNAVISRNTSQPVHQQLLLNYCFGHADSNVLMSPYGVLVNLINHGSGAKANTKIVWSKDMRHPEWLDQPPKVMEGDWHSGLSFDFVALRDIQKDEEVLIDYGPEWQAAWDEHVAKWEAPPGADMYDAAYELNGIQQVDSILPTMAEGGYGGSVKLWIHGAYIAIAGHEVNSDFARAEIHDRYEDTATGEIRYRTQTFGEVDDVDETEVEFRLMLWSLPRDAFVFDDLPYTRDHVQPWSFRHSIAIPDDIFPEAWKLNSTETI
jgi:hypothetical protein